MSTSQVFFPNDRVIITDPESPYFEQEFWVVGPSDEENSFLLYAPYGNPTENMSFNADQITKV